MKCGNGHLKRRHFVPAFLGACRGFGPSGKGGIMKVKIDIEITLDTILKFIDECRSDYALEEIIRLARQKQELMEKHKEEYENLRKFWEECN